MTLIPEIIYTQARLPLARQPADTVAVAAGRVVAVGLSGDILPLAGPATVTHSLSGRTLLPGFHDAHCHVLGFGLTLAAVTLTNVPTIPELVQRLQERAIEVNAGLDTWIRGRGYNQNILAEGRHPTRLDLDTIGGGKPFVLITHASGHAVSVSSRVLALAHINHDTPDPPGGTIVRDERGEPTGVLLETAANLAYNAAPPPPDAEKVAALGRASKALNAMGITSAVDATLGLAARDSFIEIPAYQQAAQSGALTVRCSLMMLLSQLAGMDSLPKPEAVMPETDFVRIGPAKVFTDGALTTRTAFLRSPFVGSDSLGTAVWNAEELDTMFFKAHRAGWQIAAHAIGDAAIDLCLNACGRVQARCPRPDARHRIEHAMLLWPDQIGRLARLGILPIYQPEFIMRFGDAYTSAIGTSRANRLMPYAETQSAGLPLVFSSDIPVIPGSPLDGIAAAMNRLTPSGQVLGPQHCVSVSDALRAYTEGAAYSTFLENDRGRITPGHRADFTILSGDLLTLPPDEWADGLKVAATIVGGRVVCGEV
ncbi:MAG: amidohydrolase [Janthinobacterium lividum]